MFRLAEPRPSRTIGLVWRKSNPLSSQLKQIAEIVREVGLHHQDRMQTLLSH
jgi:LysR family hydrogen peroxide-inducible transcriptional activator